MPQDTRESGGLAVHHAFREIVPRGGTSRGTGSKPFAGQVEQGLLQQRHSFGNTAFSLCAAFFRGFLVHRLRGLFLAAGGGFLSAPGTGFKPFDNPRRALSRRRHLGSGG